MFTIIAIGIMVKAALEAAEELQKQNIQCAVLHGYLKPADEEAIIEAARTTGDCDCRRTSGTWRVGQYSGSSYCQKSAGSDEICALKDYAQSGKPELLLALRSGLSTNSGGRSKQSTNAKQNKSLFIKL